MMLFWIFPGFAASAANKSLKLNPPTAPSASDPMRRNPRRDTPSQKRDSLLAWMVSMVGVLCAAESTGVAMVS